MIYVAIFADFRYPHGEVRTEVRTVNERVYGYTI